MKLVGGRQFLHTEPEGRVTGRLPGRHQLTLL
jgi:hypothetical protein